MTTSAFIATTRRTACRTLDGLTRVAGFAAPPVMRIALALPFLRSGLTRWDDFPTLSAGTLYLFEEQFSLHLFGHDVALPAPDQLAWLTAVAELALPALLLLGLGTRLATIPMIVNMLVALAVVVLPTITTFNEFVELDEVLYVAVLFWLLMAGPGKASLDHAIASRLRAR